MAGEKLLLYISCGIPEQALQELSEHFRVNSWKEPGFIPKDELMRNARGAHAILVHPPDCVDKELLEAVGPQLKVVGSCSVGLDHVDVGECRRRGVEVGHTPGVLTTAVAELTVGLLLATARRMREAIQAVQDGVWGTRWDNALWMAGTEVSGSTLGIVGLGRIGLAVAARLRAFEPARILYCGHSPKAAAQEVGAEYVPMAELLKSSDVVIATCSVSAENRHLFNREAFAAMKPSAIFVNVTRGALVDQEALYEALQSGQIGAAGLDVSTPEPLPPDHPLLGLPNLTLLPHVGSATVRTRTQMTRVTVANILAGIKGQPLPSPAP